MGRVPPSCPVCGAYALAPADHTAALLAVSDVLVLKALEAVGKWIVRAERPRARTLAATGLPKHEAHTLWPCPPETVSKALRGSWDVVPAMLDSHEWAVPPERVTRALDAYVHDLVSSQSPHSTLRLQPLLSSLVGVDVPLVPHSLNGAGTP